MSNPRNRATTAPGLKVNINSICAMLQAARKYGANNPVPIKFIFTSSLAVYRRPLPEVIKFDTITTPEGFIDGRIIHLPTVAVRPRAPSAATSTFISRIICESLKGVEAICPIGNSFDSPELNLALWIASPKVTIKNFVIAKHVSADKFLKHTHVVCLPGFTTMVREELEVMEKVGGKQVLNLVKFKDDPTNCRIVSSWPVQFDNTYSLSLGFIVDEGGILHHHPRPHFLNQYINPIVLENIT
ncbi:hypothetical protein E1B28_005559 [Marasmius oreades]|uniref:Uncharacterized protein n=1 Tax=Marasmius oreades TaxID=181124 RepID=A0A9P7UUD5_9AGAR|nr:uncharacterized protein E1B28_005559 [Marasmius oreades]KAG7094742.1 hypothetical protein E1B28_005559 [Marasmius oreades]